MVYRDVGGPGDPRGTLAAPRGRAGAGSAAFGPVGVRAERDCVVGAERFVRHAYERAGNPQDLEHALRVGDLLAELGCSDVVVAAGVLHGVVAEETGVAVAEIAAAFGDGVAGLVRELAEDPSIADHRERKRALRASVQRTGRAGMLVVAADHLARLRTADEDGVMIEALEIEHYQRSFELLVASGVRSSQVDELRSRLRMRRGPVPKNALFAASFP